ncbi:unnamed protein product [Heterobilharzia americana]|nr:unnamed protein product [Heterobilharzia americana]
MDKKDTSIMLNQTNQSTIVTTSNRTLVQIATEPVDIYLPSILTTTVILIIIAIIGTIGNSLVVWAFRKQVSQGIVSGLFILLLGCNDLFICLIVIPCTLYLDIWKGDTTDWICRAHLTMKGFVVPISACILMLIAMERFLLICFIPGIQMKRTHISLALTIIFWIGLLCAIPMGLHVRAIDVYKERDELLDLNTLKYGLSNFKSDEWINQAGVTKRCDKDETYINDYLYWYHQICVLILFLGLFLGTAGIYALIFLFVWRHESFMYEKYGNSRIKGNWVRIHATPNSSANISPSIWSPIKKRLSFRRKLKEINDVHSDKVKQCSSGNGCEREQVNDYQQQQPQQPPPPQQTLGINQTQTDLTTSTSFDASNLDRLSCVCLCEREADVEDLKTVASPVPTDQSFNIIDNSRDTVQSQCFIHLNVLKVVSTEKDKCTPEMNLHLDQGHLQQTPRSEWSAANLERRRKPHVRTAQTLALVAANFIISYTPYLVILQCLYKRDKLKYSEIDHTGQIK